MERVDVKITFTPMPLPQKVPEDNFKFEHKKKDN